MVILVKVIAIFYSLMCGSTKHKFRVNSPLRFSFPFFIYHYQNEQMISRDKNVFITHIKSCQVQKLGVDTRYETYGTYKHDRGHKTT